MWDSFHGASLDAISLGGEAVFRQGAGPLLPGCEHAPPPDPLHCVFGCGTSCNLRCANYIEYILEKEGDVAAVVAETVRSTPFIPPASYWQKVRAACDRHGALLILDEIPTCLGRTGTLFACEQFDVVPDILCIGKGLGGGILPLAAVLTRDNFNESVSNTAMGHYTHEKNPVLCAAGLATLDILEEECVLEHVREVGSYFRDQLTQLQKRHSCVRDVRGIGLMLGVELQSELRDQSDRIMYRCMELGLNFKVTMGHILTLTPPLVISRPEIDQAIGILDQALGCVER